VFALKEKVVTFASRFRGGGCSLMFSIGFPAGVCVVFGWDVLAGKKLKINFAGMKKVLTFAVPNETGFYPAPAARCFGGIEEGIGCCGVCALLRHIGRSASGGGEVLERY